MPAREAPSVELGSAPQTPNVIESPTPSEISSASSPEPQNIRATPLFRALAIPPPEPEQPQGQDELERRLPGYRRIVIPRELTLIELLKQHAGVTTDDEVLRIREARLRVVAERVGLRRLHVLAPRLRSLILDGSALSSLRDLGIGLVHLKILSVNRCGLNCLDGVWGLGALREFHAAGNRLRDLHPLAALQKLHTLDLADNPLAESNRLWTLAVCGSLRRLTLRGTPVSEQPDYRIRVASSLPMLVSLDDSLLSEDNDDESLSVPNDDASSSSDSEVEELPPTATQPVFPPDACEPGPSVAIEQLPDGVNGEMDSLEMPVAATSMRHQRRRPATTDGAGMRPLRPTMPPRPRTAVERPALDAPTRLQILNTLMGMLLNITEKNNEEWRCSGSKLTSHGAVCGNLTRALRRPTSAYRRNYEAAQKSLIEETMEDATRAVAAEIPRMPRLEDWAKFREETGRIDIDIDFNERPKGADAESAIERLERIEKETFDRLKEENTGNPEEFSSPEHKFGCSLTVIDDYEQWRDMSLASVIQPRNIDDLFKDIPLIRSNEGSVVD